MDTYETRLYDWDGTLLAVFDDWRSLSASIRINGTSNHTFSLNANDERVSLFKKDAIFEIRRKNEFIDWQVIYTGFHRTPQRQITQDGYEIFTSYGRSFEDLLRRRSLAYGEPYCKTGPADDVMKIFVYENCGAGASNALETKQMVCPPFVGTYPDMSTWVFIPGFFEPPPLAPLSSVLFRRIIDGVIPNFTVAPLVGMGGEWAGDRVYKNLHDVITEISLANRVDFAIVGLPLAGKPYGAFEFRTYYPLGTDRTVASGAVPMIFAPEFGNVATPDFTVSATEEITTVIVLGKGALATRNKLVNTTTHTFDSPWNNIELIRDARNEDSPNGLDSVIDAELAKAGEKENLTFQVIQTPSSVFGLHYFLGDLITFRMGTIVTDKRILGFDINVAKDSNTLTFNFGDTEYAAGDVLEHVIRNLVTRNKAIEHSGTI